MMRATECSSIALFMLCAAAFVAQWPLGIAADSVAIAVGAVSMMFVSIVWMLLRVRQAHGIRMNRRTGWVGLKPRFETGRAARGRVIL